VLSYRAVHDGLGRRTRKTVNGQTWQYYWDTDRLAAEVFPDGHLRVYVYPDAFALVPILFLEYRAELDRHGMVCSMSRKGDCWDNAVAESFFATLKGELIDRECWPTKARARAAIVEYIACFYNSKRSHSVLGYTSPMEYEMSVRRWSAAA